MNTQEIIIIAVLLIIGFFIIRYVFKKTDPTIQYQKSFYPTKREGKAYRIKQKSSGGFFTMFKGNEVFGNSSDEVFNKLKSLEGIE